ncbi:MAG: 50S ribosomal protein L30 [Firmicutes bacterium]|nr:50S ribosomal protein L30 [Bacillota bacterium]HXL04760.1 50S ribosomal protein L30 [Bacillota bacterium]
MLGDVNAKDNQETKGMLKITLKRSVIGRPKDQKATVKALGLRKLNQSRCLPDNPAVRGMIEKVAHLVDAEEVTK